MRVLKFERFQSPWTNQAERLVAYVNDNKIKQEDILKVIHCASNDIYLFYFAEE